VTRKYAIAFALALAMIWLGLAKASVASHEDFKVIVNPKNPLTVLERDFLREAFLKKATNWPDGKAIRPIDLAGRLPIREQFIMQVLKKTPSQLRSYWTQRIFSGLGVPPPEADSAQEAVRYVLANAGAVAYVPASHDTGGAKVVGLAR
jgi:ABC-type phosphate transport system substrate-binding protein